MKLVNQDIYLPVSADSKDAETTWVNGTFKKVKQVYVLTEEELEGLKIEAYSKGYELGKEYGKDPF